VALIVTTVAATALAGGALAGCAKSDAASPPIQVQPGSNSATHTVGDADNGRTITLHTGDRLTVRLASTYWQFSTNTSSTALKLAATPITAATPPGTAHCYPGMGCGTVTATFQAVAGGKATIAASRTTCGEAMRCTGNAGAYQLTVMVG
jgi:hypothetical protein